MLEEARKANHGVVNYHKVTLEERAAQNRRRAAHRWLRSRRGASEFRQREQREQFAHGIFPDPGAILPTGFPERECQVFWHNRPPDGLLEGHIFTDGSSSGSGALRWAGWAVVAVDDAGNLKAAAYGAVPSDVSPGQSATDGEDYAAAMAGQFTLDPLTLYIDCEGTIATVNGPCSCASYRLF